MRYRAVLTLIIAGGLFAACTVRPPASTPSPDQGLAASAAPSGPTAAATARSAATPGDATRQRTPAAAPPGGDQDVSLTPTPLLANNEKTAKARLVTTALHIPEGLRFSAQSVSLPPGLSISLLAVGLSHPRFMAFDSAGNLLVADQSGSIFRYPASGGKFAPSIEAPAPLLGGLNGPSSLAFNDGYLYVGETNRINRYRYNPSDQLGAAEVVIPNLPTGGHSTRTVAFGPDGKLYVSVGSSCNICEETDERRAAILRYNPDGSDGQRFAWGLRNAVGLAFQPESGLLWATVNERDNQGNEIPPDLVTIVRQGEDFGWPRCQPPDAKPQRPGIGCAGITPPIIGIQAHSAPLGLAFAINPAFPPEYHGDLFVAQHGSWNRRPPAEPKLLRIHFDHGQPVSVEDFAKGWQLADGSRWGRPAGIVQAPDGSLIISDDQAGVLYQIAGENG